MPTKRGALRKAAWGLSYPARGYRKRRYQASPCPKRLTYFPFDYHVFSPLILLLCINQSIAYIITGTRRTGYESTSALFFMLVVTKSIYTEYFMTRVNSRKEIKGKNYPQSRDS